MTEKFNSLHKIAPEVSRETYQKLEDFEKLFLRWASRINLVSASTLDDVWTRHILDSAQLFPMGMKAKRWLDLGSGGGFPGLILAFLILDEDDATIDLVESNQKKAAFLRTVTGSFSLPARVNSLRIEAFSPVHAPEIVTARALASLSQLLALTERWLSDGARGLFPKGRDYRREIEDCAHLWRFDLVEHPSVTDSQAVILEIANLRRR